MRKVNIDLNEIATQIKGMKGESVKMQVNKGRKRIEKYTGVIESVYPSIFTVRIDNPVAQDFLSYSYSEVLCGDVKIIPNLKK